MKLKTKPVDYILAQNTSTCVMKNMKENLLCFDPLRRFVLNNCLLIKTPALVVSLFKGHVKCFTKTLVNSMNLGKAPGNDSCHQ